VPEGTSKQIKASRRVAVVLLNLGGPDSLKAVQPFLFNLFADPAIISAPAPIRYPLAALISVTRGRMARGNYAMMGGASPLGPGTQAQAGALRAILAEELDAEVKVFVAMRYWRPDSAQTAREVEAFAPDDIVLLPLYPQYSTTTTASSMKAWAKAYRGPGRVRSVCCYPLHAGLVEAHAAAIESAWEQAGRPDGVRLLFSAHGLPEQVIERGDPYQAQVEALAEAVAARLGDRWDWRVCYQSRVGPLKWLGPTTLDCIEQAGAEGLGVIITPIAFVSEHVETLVELDHDYAKVAQGLRVSPYIRVPALGVRREFIEGLADVTLAALNSEAAPGPGSAYVCPGRWSGCPAGADREGLSR
jgi:protoporphyrin/coproporphyrin ferrochelatase